MRAAKIAIIVAIACVCWLSWMFRYEVSSDGNIRYVVKHDRWTGQTYICTYGDCLGRK